jgi:uncharacterized OB-fold protein
MPDRSIPSSLSAPYLAGLSEGLVRLQVCHGCSKVQTLARYACSDCGATDLGWTTASGLGTVYAVTSVARAPSEEFRALAPYTLVLVDLDEGARLMAHGHDGIRIGDRVQASFFEHAGQRLVRFVPIDESRDS